MKIKPPPWAAACLAALALTLGHAIAGAIRPGFAAHVLAANDDVSTGLVPLGFSINPFGQTYTQVYVNNNGNVTLDSAFSSFEPRSLNETLHVIFAPFFADADTRGTGSGRVTYSDGSDRVDGRRAFGVNWVNVGYYSAKTDKLNSFQLVLIDRSDTAVGNFDVEFNYDRIQWEAGDASGGLAGLGGTSARTGYANGVLGSGRRTLELAGSGATGAFLDTNLVSGLVRNSLGSAVPGRYVFAFRGGLVTGIPPVANAGPPQGAVAGELVTLDATASYDPEGLPLTYQWVQTSGAPVTLSNPTGVTTTFTAPAVEDTLLFRLEVQDITAQSASAVGSVAVRGVATKPATLVTTTSATLNGTVNPAGTETAVFFEYGLDTTYGLLTPTQSAGNGTVPSTFSATLAGLTTGVTYHYRAAAVAGSVTVSGLDRTFTPAAPLPILVSQNSSSVTQTGATLRALVNPNGFETTVHFEYGPSLSLGTATALQTIPAGTAPVEVIQTIAGLTIGTTYAWRTVAVNSFTQTSGSNQFFATSGGAPRANDDFFSATGQRVGQRLDVLLNDQGLGPLLITSADRPSGGTVEIIEGGAALRYTPNGRFRGVDSFAYFMNNATGPESLAVVTVRSPFLESSGTYVGLIADVDNSGGVADGSVVLTVTKSGSFSGRIFLTDQSSYTFAGFFDGDGDYRGTVGPARIPIALHLEPAPVSALLGDFRITGSVLATAISLEAFHAAYSGAPLPEAGKYTVLLNTNPPSSVAIPPGIGYATLTATSTGSVRLAGRLPDDAPFSAGTTLVGDGNGRRQFILFDPKVYTSGGSLTGPVLFEARSGSDCAGPVTWVRAPRSRSTYYAAGFDFNAQLIGARFARPAPGQLVIPLPAGNAPFLLDGGGLAAPIAELAALSSNHTVAIAGGNPQNLRLSLNPSSGLFTGSFVHPLSQRKTALKGALYQHPGAPQAAGYFLGPAVGGKVLLAPAP